VIPSTPVVSPLTLILSPLRGEEIAFGLCRFFRRLFGWDRYSLEWPMAIPSPLKGRGIKG